MIFSAPQTQDNEDIAIFVFIDALGWRIFDNHRSALLADELQLARPLETVLGYSCSCDPTILTGRLPQEHGHFSFFQFAPERSPFRSLKALRCLPNWIAGRGRVRRQLSKLIAKQKKYTGYFQLYNVRFDRLPYMDYSEKRDLYQPGGILSGDRVIFDHLREAGTPFHLSDWRQSETENLQSLCRDLVRGEVQWAYLYLAGLDAILHRDGTESESVSQHIRWYDQQLRSVLSAAREHYRQVRMYVFSDHGMTDVVSTSELMLDIEAFAYQKGLRFGRDYGAVYDSTMARFWFRTENAEQQLSRALSARPDGRILTDDQLKDFGCFFPNQEYGELFFLLDPGVLVCPSDMGAQPLRGMHGYTPEHPDSTALIASTEAFVPPTRLDGLFSLMMNEAQRCSGAEPLLVGPPLL